MTISLDRKLKVVELHAQGLGLKRISQATKIVVPTVQKLLQIWKERGTFERKQGSGRPKILDNRGERLLVRTAMSNPLMSARDLGDNLEVSRNTVYRTLENSGIKKRTIKPRYFISPQNQRKRVAWAKDHLPWGLVDWSRVIFSDEVSIAWNPSSLKIWTRKGRSQYIPNHVKRQYPIRVMFWGCISYDGVGRIVPIDGTINAKSYKKTLKNHLFTSFPDILGGNLIFQHDGATPHTSSETWLDSQGVDVLSWPAQSPDINPIENLWGIIKKKISVKLCTSSVSEEELIKVFSEAWYNIDPQIVEKLYISMNRRLRAVIQKEGLPSKY